MCDKICTKCSVEKKEEDFFWKNKKLNRRHSQCKDCYRNSRSSKEHYEKYKDEYVKRAKGRQAKLVSENRKHLLEYFKTHHCIECDEDNPVVLEFDHRDMKNKFKGISQMLRDYTWEQILKEIDKCDVLCSNHHKIKTSKQMGWWYENI